MLFDFAKKDTEHHVTYALSGISKTSGALEIRLVPQEKLDGGMTRRCWKFNEFKLTSFL
jgi:hypothetical protein